MIGSFGGERLNPFKSLCAICGREIFDQIEVVELDR
jgi:hypothetical protein